MVSKDLLSVSGALILPGVTLSAANNLILPPKNRPWLYLVKDKRMISFLFYFL